jgi:hypothetical protein
MLQGQASDEAALENASGLQQARIASRAANRSVYCTRDFGAVVRAEPALTAGGSASIAVAMGVVSATFGAVIRDILGGEGPLILRREIYVTAALAGAAVFVGLLALGLRGEIAATAGFAACLVIRALALSYGWSLPVYRAREGRTVEEAERLGR